MDQVQRIELDQVQLYLVDQVQRLWPTGISGAEVVDQVQHIELDQVQAGTVVPRQAKAEQAGPGKAGPGKAGKSEKEGKQIMTSNLHVKRIIINFKVLLMNN